MSERSQQTVRTSCETRYGTFLFKFKDIVELLLTPRESCMKSSVSGLATADASLGDVVSGGVEDSRRIQYKT